MDLGETFSFLEDEVLKALDDPDDMPIRRTLDVIGLEKQMHRSFKPWAKNHKKRYKSKGLSTVPYVPTVFPDQMINIPGREVMIPFGISEESFLKLNRWLLAKSVGSTALTNQMIDSFKTQPAFPDEEISLADFAVETLDSGGSVALATGHLDRLSDVAEFTNALKIAIMERHGFSYASKFKVVLNKLMTRESLGHLWMPTIISTGLAPRYGIPLVGAEKWDVSTEAQGTVNGLLAKFLIAEMRDSGQVVGIVPAGSAAIQTHNQTTNELEKLEFPLSSATAGLFSRYDVIMTANRWKNRFTIGSVILSKKPPRMSSKQYGHEITDRINHTLALQASELAGGIPVDFVRLASPGSVAVESVVSAHVDASE